MCGIAGIIDLAGKRPAPEGVVQRMARALIHRGPDEEGFLERPGISLLVHGQITPAGTGQRQPVGMGLEDFTALQLCTSQRCAQA